MPTYEYECHACGRSMDIFQRMTEEPLKKCPECGELALKRKIGTGAGIIFKGSGFYETDYKRKESGPPSGGSGSETKSNSKTEAKSTETKKDSSPSSGGDS